MALTRSQLLAGNQAQGAVLEGQVQGVKRGAGVIIEPDGTIKVDATTAEGLVKLNSPLAFNGYVWPNTSGSVGQFLTDDGGGGLSWAAPNTSSTVTVGDVAPNGSLVGRLWFDTTVFILKVYEDAIGAAKWTPVSRGMDAEVVNTASSPTFQGGDGTEDEPFNLQEVSTLAGSFLRFGEVVTITGFAPYQYVPITDLNASINGNRFSASSYFTDGNGVLTFRVLFTDYPVTPAGQGYSALLEVGFGSVFIGAPVSISAPLTLASAGSISGAPQVGQILNYSIGQADGGTPPYAYIWEWRRSSDQAIIQINGDSLTVPESLTGDRVFVQLRATDANGIIATGSTAGYPTSPAVISKGPFPATNVLFPTALDQEVATTWLDAGTNLESDGCIEISTDGVTWGQGPFPIANGGILETRWIISPTCGGAVHNTTITGCVFSPIYQECGSLTLDRIPSPFSFLPEGDIQLNALATAIPVTLVGYNATAFVTYSGLSTLTAIEGSLDNGASWTNIPAAGADTFQIKPGQNLTVRGRVGGVTGTAYNAVINVGEGQSVQTATFTATTTTQTAFTTVLNFPSTTSQGYSITQPGGSSVAIPGAVSASWADGTTTLTATGCLEIQVENSSGGVLSAWGVGPFGIIDGNILRTRWKNTSVCGLNVHGFMITGTVTNVPAAGSKTSNGQLMIDRVVGAYDFSDLTGQNVSTQVSSNTVSLSGYNATTYLTASGTLTSLQASVNGGTWTSIPSSGTSFAIEPVAPGGTPPTLQIRGTTGANTAFMYGANVVIGDGGTSSITTDVWNATTSAAVKTVLTPSVTSPTNGSTGINPTSLNPPGVNVTSSAYQVINGASATQLSSEWEVRSGSTSGTVVYTQVKTSAFTTWFIPQTVGATAILQPNTDYFIRVRYVSADSPAVTSQWSPFVQFKTATTFTQTWVLRKSWSGWDLGFNQIANNGSLWMAVEGGENYSRTTTSTDGINWVQAGTISSTQINDLAFGNGWWLTVGSGSGSVRRSNNNGSTWTTPTNSGLTSNTLRSIAFGAGTFVTVGNNGTIQTTTDGSSWVSRTSGVTVPLTSVIWDGNQFVAVGPGRVLTSTTGTSWTSVNMPSVTTPQIRYLQGTTPQYIVIDARANGGAVGGGSATAYTSTNLSSWAPQTLPTAVPGAIAAGNGVFVLGDFVTSTTTVLKVWNSPSGLTGTWVQQPFPNSNSYYHTHYLNYGTTSTGVGRFVLIDHNFNVFSTT
jgi:hypothetical protein